MPNTKPKVATPLPYSFSEYNLNMKLEVEKFKAVGKEGREGKWMRGMRQRRRGGQGGHKRETKLSQEKLSQDGMLIANA
jgi:hypothetical protein